MKENILQINDYSFDERYYQLKTQDEDGNVVVKYFPSVTFVIDCTWNKGDAFERWLGQVGTENASKIVEEAGDIGSYVHNSIEKLIEGETVKSSEIDSIFRPYPSLKTKASISAFMSWMEDYKPRIVQYEYIVYHEELGYAGTVDLHCWIRRDRLMTKKDLESYEKELLNETKKSLAEEFGDDVYLDRNSVAQEISYSDQECWVDFKTSKKIYDEHKMQLAAYLYTETGGDFSKGSAALLQLGNSTRKGYSFNVLKQGDDEEGKTIEVLFSWFKWCLDGFKLRWPNAKPRTDYFPEEFSLRKEVEQ